MKRILNVVVLAVFVMQATGCYSHYIIPKSQIHYLDGYDVHQTQVMTAQAGYVQGVAVKNPTSHIVMSKDGKAVTYDVGKELSLYLRPSGNEPVYVSADGTPLAGHDEKITGHFQTINIKNGQFSGLNNLGQTLTEKMTDIEYAEIKQKDAQKTRVLTGVLTSIIGLAAGFAIYFAITSKKSQPQRVYVPVPY